MDKIIYAVKPRKPEATNENLLADIRRVAGELNFTSITMKQYRDNGGIYDVKTFKKHLGWNNALVKAGLSIAKVRSFSEEELFSNMKKVWDELGRIPLPTDMVKPLSYISYGTYKRRFNGWQTALETFSAHMSEDGKTQYISDLETETRRIEAEAKDGQIENGETLRYSKKRLSSFEKFIKNAQEAEDELTDNEWEELAGIRARTNTDLARKVEL